MAQRKPYKTMTDRSYRAALQRAAQIESLAWGIVMYPELHETTVIVSPSQESSELFSRDLNTAMKRIDKFIQGGKEL